MKLISRVIFLAACVLAAYSFPQDIDIANCNEQYQQRQQKINAEISNQTAECVAATNVTMNQTLENLAPQANIARDNLTSLETNLHNCTSIADNLEFVHCVNDDYKENKILLDTGSYIAADVETKASTSFYNAQKVQQYCIQNVLDIASKNFTLASQDYQQCMSGVFNYGDNK